MINFTEYNRNNPFFRFFDMLKLSKKAFHATNNNPVFQ